MRPAFVLPALLAACGGGGDSLAVTAADPPYGPVDGGTLITLAGAGFSDDAAAPDRVLVGGREAPVAFAIDDASLGFVLPPGERPGDVEIVVFDAGRNARATGIFHYSTPPTITAVSPADVDVSAALTMLTITGTGFLDEGAGLPTVAVDGQLLPTVTVTSDTTLVAPAPFGRALLRPDVAIANTRGRAALHRAFRYIPSTHAGLVLFPPFGAEFALFLDPTDNTAITIPWVVSPSVRFTSATVDANGDYWAADRNLRFGRIDMTTQSLEQPIPTSGWFPAMQRVAATYYAIERGSLRFGTFDPGSGVFTPIGTASVPCCGSYGLAFDGTTMYLAARDAGVVGIRTVDLTTGDFGTPVVVTGPPGLHIEEMRFLAGTLYAASRDGSLLTIDPTTGVSTTLPVSFGRFNAMEVFAP